MKSLTLVFALLSLCFISTNFAQQKPAEKLFEIKGIVKNQDKISLAGLNLFFEGKESKNTIVTDENGGFAVKLPVGKYKVTVNAAVSKNFAAFLELFDNHLNPNNFELIIETDKSCCSLMSDGSVTEVIKYVSPPFPAAARAVRASGEVVVFVKIDAEGKVTSANAEIGHPLLRAASVQAAKQWLFSSDKNGMEREGKIIFAFVPPAEKIDKPKDNLFVKPNRFEIFAPQPLINTVSY